MKIQQRKTLLLFLLLIVVYALLIQNVFAPFGPQTIESGDSLGYNHAEQYFFNNLTLFPIPKLNLYTDYNLYPYGFEFLAHGWSLERHYFCSILTHFFGDGPWLTMYGIFSFTVAALGLFLLYSTYVSVNRGIVAAVFMGLFNLAAYVKFPGHQNLSMLHWSVLSVATDIIISSLLLTHKLPIGLVFFRIFLLIASMGLDVSIVAGFGLTSFTLTFGFYFISRIRSYWPNFRQNLFSKNTFINFVNIKILLSRSGKSWAMVWATLGLVCFWAFIPLLFQVIGKYKEHTWARGGTYWASPFRLLIPWFSFLNPYLKILDKVFADQVEFIGNMAPGWSVVIPGLIAFYFVYKKKLVAFYPALASFMLYSTYHPSGFPVLKIFPWFGEARVSGRLSLIFPALFVGIVLQPTVSYEIEKFFRRFFPKVRMTHLFLLALVCLALELKTFFHYRNKSTFTVSRVQPYFNSIKETQGEALLEWPFCISSGSGIGTHQLCPYDDLLHGIFGLDYFHKKKILSFYLGRALDSQVEPFNIQGWNYLLSTAYQDGQGNYYSSRQSDHFYRCFNNEEWEFFTDFYRAGKFCGVQLYTDRLAPGCLEEFEKRLGPVVANGELPTIGKLSFIKKSDNDKTFENQDKLLSLKFPAPAINYISGERDLIAFDWHPFVKIENFSGIAVRPGWPARFRRISQKQSSIQVNLPHKKTVKLELELRSEVPNQMLSFYWNNSHLQNIRLSGVPQKIVFDLVGTAGLNQLTINAEKSWSLSVFIKHVLKHEGLAKAFNLVQMYHRWNTAGDKAFAVATEIRVTH